MRLTHTEHHILKQTAEECFGPGVGVRLFGSRADDTARGGDIDLLIEVNTTNPADIMRAQTLFMARLLTRLGDRKVDVLVDYPSRQTHPPIFDVARREGIPL
jgi:predicted nucleotidyltransferase